MKKLDELMRKEVFGFSEVDVRLSGYEMLRTLIIGAGICAAPFVAKALLNFIL